MPAKGKHRRPRTNPITRGIVAAGTGGAAIAIPLIGATGAHAAERSAVPSVAPERAVSVAHTAPAAPAPQTAQQAATAKTVKTYSVSAGDYLAKIAETQKVSGGWEKLYEDNREVVGDDPSLIHPGLKLTIGAKGESASSAGKAEATPKKKTAPAKPAPAKPAPAEPAPKADTTANQPAAQSSGTGYTAPVDGGTSTAYRAAGGSWSSGYHTGVDFSAASGTTVKAVGPGTVVSAGWAGSYGNEVVIKHDDGQYSQYAHLSSLAVSPGQSVGGGDRIGLSGSTGNSTGPHLHFEIRTGPSYGSDVDPLAYLRGHGVSI
ncbi:peptidoglycan DD-metalloendopeptidase family protein [Streptomyces sp. NBC_01508]|uniref:peptidoglycan DD-metalloendopeptidase family protein n=1 Tax=Streptomyces sp. NBC_01508 TaxID=2903888 RepID=UPI00386454BE